MLSVDCKDGGEAKGLAKKAGGCEWVQSPRAPKCLWVWQPSCNPRVGSVMTEDAESKLAGWTKQTFEFLSAILFQYIRRRGIKEDIWLQLQASTHVCAHTYVYTHPHVHTPTCTHTYMCPHSHVHIPTCAHICMCPHLHVSTPTCTHTTCAHTHMCLYLHVSIPTCAHTYLCTCLQVPTSTCAQTHICTHLHTYLCQQTCVHKNIHHTDIHMRNRKWGERW